ncbi:MAG: alanine racemase [Roseomonas sp.]|nr:alanine racemase [Roseomonas sp.]MCA3378880.1 alanine racemase [Roseomonas sp.]
MDPSAILHIDLGAIAANWRALAKRAAPGAVAGVVKANAYGLGAARIAPAVQAAGCRHFFVAHLAEGMALRVALGAGPMIAVLNGFAPGADEDAGLVPVLNSLGDVLAHAAAGRSAGRAQAALLHLDTGMARLGLDAGEQARLAADHSLLAGLDLLYVMSHLACADESDHPLNAKQAARFAQASAVLPKLKRSFANSSGLFLGSDYASDLARPGCALYGINPTPGAPNPMQQVIRLEAPILQIRDIPAGASVGYGASFVATRPSRIATIAVGYADGYLRCLSGQGVAAYRDMILPMVGRVSMDLITLDVTDAPGIAPGDTVQLVGGAAPSPDGLAARAGTIGYEILTSLGDRYRRDYRAG